MHVLGLASVETDAALQDSAPDFGILDALVPPTNAVSLVQEDLAMTA